MRRRYTVLALMLLASPASAEPFTCTVERVIDGDTWRCVELIAPLRVWGIDAPDWNCRGRKHCQEDRPAAERARGFVIQLIHGRRLECDAKDHDRFGRIVAQCRLDGLDVACTILQAGHEMIRFSKGAYRSCK